MLTGWHLASSFFFDFLGFFFWVGGAFTSGCGYKFQSCEISRDRSFWGSDFSFQTLNRRKYSLQISSLLMNNDRLGEGSSETNTIPPPPVQGARTMLKENNSSVAKQEMESEMWLVARNRK